MLYTEQELDLSQEKDKLIKDLRDVREKLVQAQGEAVIICPVCKGYHKIKELYLVRNYYWDYDDWKINQCDLELYYPEKDCLPRYTDGTAVFSVLLDRYQSFKGVVSYEQRGPMSNDKRIRAFQGKL